MSETRKQFYSRMELLVLEECLIDDRASEIQSELRMGMRDAAARGYAQALRDVLELARIHDENVGELTDAIYRHAAARGIDLDGGES